MFMNTVKMEVAAPDLKVKRHHNVGGVRSQERL